MLINSFFEMFASIVLFDRFDVLILNLDMWSDLKTNCFKLLVFWDDAFINNHIYLINKRKQYDWNLRKLKWDIMLKTKLIDHVIKRFIFRHRFSILESFIYYKWDDFNFNFTFISHNLQFKNQFQRCEKNNFKNQSQRCEKNNFKNQSQRCEKNNLKNEFQRSFWTWVRSHFMIVWFKSIFNIKHFNRFNDAAKSK